MATKKTTTKRSSQRGIKSSQTATSSLGTRSRSGSAGSNTNEDESDRSRRLRSTQSGSKTNERDAADLPTSRTTNSSRSNITKRTTGSPEQLHGSNRTSRSSGMSDEKGRSSSRSYENDNRGALSGRGNSRTTNRGSIQEGNYNRQWDDREYGRSGYREEYPRDRRGMRDFDDQYNYGWRGRNENDYGYQGRSGYGDERYTGRDQNRYSDDRYERRESDYGRQSDRNQDRQNYGSGWTGSERINRGPSRNYTGDQEYYTEGEWNRQRGQGWNKYDNSMEQTDGYRGTTFRSRPSGKDDEGLRKLLTDQLKDLYWAEKELTKAIPKLIKKATSPELKNALNEHLHTTESQVERVKEIFGLLGEKASAKKCVAMEGLIKEADEITASLDEGSVRDAGIICAAQKVEHYEIATYGCLATYAEILNEMEATDLFEEILQEEKDADKTLTRVAQEINWEASEEEDEEEEEEDEEEEEEEYEEEEDSENMDKREKFSETDSIQT